MIQNKTVMWLASCPNCDPPLPSPPTHAFSISWVRGFSPIKIKFFFKFWI